MLARRRAVIAGALSAPALIIAGPAKAARHTLKLASELVDTHPGIIRCREAAQAIQRDTNGQVEIRVFPNSQLGSAQDMLNQIRSGAIDLYPAAAAGLSAVVPVASISSMGFAFKDYGQVWSAVDGKLGAFIRDEIAKTGSILALDKMWDNGFRQVTNSLRPITGPQDLKGIKLRVPLAPLYISMFTALGAAPTGISVAELYTSLQSKLVDGQENPLPIIDLYKYYEVQKFCSVTNHMWDGFWLIANQHSWSRIADDHRAIAANHLNQAALDMRADVAALNNGAADRLKQHGMAINPVDDPAAFRKMLTDAGFYAEWRKTYGDAAWSALESTSGTLELNSLSSVVRPNSGAVFRTVLAADRMVDRVARSLAALLLLAEILLMGGSVVARYALHRPLIWSDEVATTLFIWLTMLGATLALRRGEHLRLTVLLAAVPPPVRAAMDAATALLSALFSLALIVFGLQYVSGSAAMVTPALGMSAAWHAAAMPVGGALMLHAAATRLLSGRNGMRPLIVAALAVLGVGIALWLPGDALADLDNWNLLIFFVGLVCLTLALGLPIAFCFGLVTIAYLGLTTDTPLSVVLGRMDGGMSDIILLSIPLFVFLGKLMAATGMAKALVDFLALLLGNIRGGLSYALLVAMYVVSGISGAKTADMAAVAPVLFPEMRARGSHGGEMVSLLTASAVMSETIPPSLVLIAIATTVGISMAALFTAGLLPALIAAVALCILVRFRSRRDATMRMRSSRRALAAAFLTALPGLVLPFIIRAAVVEGVATATEVSTVGIAYTSLVGLLLYRQMSWRKLVPMLVETAVLSGAVLLILGSANAMAWALTQSGFSDQLADALTRLPGGQAGFLATSIVVFVVSGSVLEGLPAIALFGPLLFPIARAIGVHEVHFAMVAILSMGLGLYMPPFGVGYYSACAIGGVNPDEGMRRVWPYLGVLLGVIMLIAAVPFLSTCFLT